MKDDGDDYQYDNGADFDDGDKGDYKSRYLDVERYVGAFAGTVPIEEKTRLVGIVIVFSKIIWD